MIEAYKIAIKLHLVNGVSAGITALSGEFLSLNRHIGASNANLVEMERRMGVIKRMGLISGAIAGAGVGMLVSLKGPIGMAMEWEREAAKLRQMGLGDSQVEDAQKFVRATDIIGTSMQQRMRLFTEAQGAFRESGMGGQHALEAAKVMMPILGRYEVASGLLSGPHKAAVEGAMRSLNKTVEMMGGLGDTNRANEIATGVFKAVQSSGKMVDERQLKQFVAYASSAGNQQSIRTIFGGLEPIIGELGGSTTAVGLRTAYTRTNGMMSLPPKLMLHEMQRLNMLDGTGKKQTTDLAQLQSTNVIDYAVELLRRYKSAGITSQTDRERENSIILGTNGAKVYNKIMAQMTVLQESLKSYDMAQGPASVINKEKNGPMMAVEKFHKALDDLGLVVGQTVLPIFTPFIQRLTELAREMGRHPNILKVLAIGFVGLGSAMAIGGALGLATTTLKGFSLALGASGGATGLLGILGKTVPAIGLMAAAIGGMAVGSFIYSCIEGTKAAELLGSAIAHIFAFFGNKEAKDAIARMNVTHNGGAEGGWEDGGSRNIRIGRGATVRVTTHLNVDGRKMAENTTQHQARELGRPNTGPRTQDGSMAPRKTSATGAW